MPHSRRVCAVALAALGCSPAEDAVSSNILGPDCSALIRAARRAERCDPALGALSSALTRDPDERRCRLAIRTLVGGQREGSTPVRSIYEPDEPSLSGPLAPAELRALDHLPLPATLTIVPDLQPSPGLPPTSATVAEVPLELMERGRLRIALRPGRHALLVRHAGDEQLYCVELDPCDDLSLTSHGSRLAPHPRIQRGPCAQ